MLIVSACAQSSIQEPLEVRTRPVALPELVLPEADPIRTRPVEWTIITRQNYEQIFTDLKRRGQPVALFGLTETGYENLALNLNDLRTFIQQQNSIILAYRNFYIRNRAVISNAVIME